MTFFLCLGGLVYDLIGTFLVGVFCSDILLAVILTQARQEKSNLPVTDSEKLRHNYAMAVTLLWPLAVGMKIFNLPFGG